jgi:chromosome segregation ATPase
VPLQPPSMLQVLDSEVAKVSSNLKAMEAQLSSIKASHARKMSDVNAELHTAQQNVATQQTQLDRYAATLQSEHVDADNRNATVDNMRCKLKNLCAP